MKSFTFILLSLLSGLSGHAQSVSLSTGFATDANNAREQFYFIPLQFEWQPGEDLMGIHISYDAALNNAITSEAYTLLPSLEPRAYISGRIGTNLLTVGFSVSFNLYRPAEEKRLQLIVLPLAYTFQDSKVRYENFDDEHYTLLNPQTSENTNGFCSGLGLKYLSGNKFITFNLQTPPPVRNTRDDSDGKFKDAQHAHPLLYVLDIIPNTYPRCLKAIFDQPPVIHCSPVGVF